MAEANGPEEIVVVIITTGSWEEARRVAEGLLGDRLVACANLVPGVTSLYWWQGEREEASEVLVVAKTRRTLFPSLLAAVRQLHSYEVFETLALPVAEVNPDYAQWVVEETRAP